MTALGDQREEIRRHLLDARDGIVDQLHLVQLVEWLADRRPFRPRS